MHKKNSFVKRVIKQRIEVINEMVKNDNVNHKLINLYLLEFKMKELGTEEDLADYLSDYYNVLVTNSKNSIKNFIPKIDDYIDADGITSTYHKIGKYLEESTDKNLTDFNFSEIIISLIFERLYTTYDFDYTDTYRYKDGSKSIYETINIYLELFIDKLENDIDIENLLDKTENITEFSYRVNNDEKNYTSYYCDIFEDILEPFIDLDIKLTGGFLVTMMYSGLSEMIKFNSESLDLFHSSEYYRNKVDDDSVMRSGLYSALTGDPIGIINQNGSFKKYPSLLNFISKSINIENINKIDLLKDIDDSNLRKRFRKYLFTPEKRKMYNNPNNIA